MNQISLPSTEDRILDVLLTYAIMDLGLRVDPNIRFEITLGREIFLKIRSEIPAEKLGERMLLTLRENSRSFTVADGLNFPLNVGSMRWFVRPSVCFYCLGKKGCNSRGECGKTNIPAYAVLNNWIDKAIECFSFPWKPKPITKTKSKKKRDLYSTAYVGITPYWSKGERIWDSGKWRDPPTKVVYPVLPFALYGMALYVLKKKVGDVLVQLFFSPPFGKILVHKEAIKLLALIKRIVNIANLTMGELFRLETPLVSLPLLLPCLLDVSAIYMLYEIMPSMLFVNYDMKRGYPVNPRGYEEFSLADVIEFYKQIGEHFWSFRSMITDLLRIATRREQYRSLIFSILIELALSIKNREPSFLNNALIKVQSLRKEVKGVKVHTLKSDEVIAAHIALSNL